MTTSRRKDLEEPDSGRGGKEGSRREAGFEPSPGAMRFRNINATPDGHVEDWGFEGLLAAVDRGGFRDWQRIISAVREDPWGPVARTLEREVFTVAESSGVVSAMEAALELARSDAKAQEQHAVAEELRKLLSESGMTRTQFADRLGTSASRLSTYLTGTVTPSAALMVRARNVARITRDASGGNDSRDG